MSMKAVARINLILYTKIELMAKTKMVELITNTLQEAIILIYN